MGRHRPDRRSWWRRPRPGLTLALLVAAIASYGLLVVFSHRIEQRSRRAWEVEGNSLDQLVRRYPSRGTNSQAREVETIAAELGLRLVPNWSSRPLRLDPGAVEQWQSVRDALGEFVVTHLRRDDGRIDAPPQAVADYLREHRQVLARLRSVIADSDPPLWRRELDRGPEARLPNLLGQVALHRILVADALEALRGRGWERAAADLEASWSLAAGLREDPVLIEQFVSMAVLRFQAGVLRRLPEADSRWSERLAGAGDRGLLLDALRHEVAALSMVDPTRLTGELSASERAFGWLAAPYLRVSHADALTRWQQALSGLEQRPSLCPPPGRERLDWRVASRPWWNRLEDSLQAGFSATGRLLRLQLDLELTRHWLALNLERARSGHWPAELPLGGASAACPEERWLYHVSPEGEVEVRLSRSFPAPMHGWALPLRHRSGF